MDLRLKIKMILLFNHLDYFHFNHLLYYNLLIKLLNFDLVYNIHQ